MVREPGIQLFEIWTSPVFGVLLYFECRNVLQMAGQNQKILKSRCSPLKFRNLYLFLTRFFPGVLHLIFECLYDLDIIDEEAFLAWETDEDPAEIEGKGVAIKSTTQFFTWLAEAEDD